MMTPKQRWQAVLAGQRPDRAPCDYWATAELTTRLRADLGCATDRELFAALGVDKCIYLAPRHPRATEDTWHIPSLFSIWNVPTVRIPYGDGLGFYEEAVNPPLAGDITPADIDRFPWPDPAEWDYPGLRAQCLEWPGHPIVGATYEPFFLYCRVRGMEQALEDLLVNPAIADAMMERIFHIFAGIVRGSLASAGDLIDLIFVAEDLGTQDSLLMSPAAFRRFIKPWLARMCDIIHEGGAHVFHHDDGAIFPLLPELLDIGIDILNPIQWRCRGMERERLAAAFGSRVVFHGGVDNQHTLPFGTPADVRNEVADNLRLFKNGKGYIVSPCHNMQANTPTENVVALYSAVRECGA